VVLTLSVVNTTSLALASHAATLLLQKTLMKLIMLSQMVLTVQTVCLLQVL
jgi:hypothetical protein